MCDLCLGIDMLCMLCAHLDRRRILSLRLRLDVDIGALGIELVSMPNQTSIDIRLQYQNHCLDADEIAIDGIKEQANTDSCLDVHTCGI